MKLLGFLALALSFGTIWVQAEKPECASVTCDRHCENGFKKDENGCDICECNECEPVRCKMYCEHGWKKDENGCEICQCNECPQVMCARHCENGFKKDENGCDICECNECPQVMCARYCEHGFKKDANGCDICECNECEPVRCRMYCEHGWKKDENGCEICECAEAPKCNPVTCARHCENGFKKDENGCDICECNKCPQVMCMIYCEYGFKQDDNGCNICACNDKPPCPPVMCDLFCDLGFKKDRNGCEICECIESAPTCKPLTCEIQCKYGKEVDQNGCEICKCKKPICPTDQPCNMSCPFGNREDLNGCPVCECKEHVCEGIECGRGDVCKPTVKECQNGICMFEPRCQRETAKERCSHEASPGMCRAAHRRWFYNTQTQICEQFIYGGCGGNRNNFLTMTECQMICEDIRKPNVIHVSFQMKHTMDNVKPHLERIERSVHDKLGEWLQLEKKYIIDVTATETSAHEIRLTFQVRQGGSSQPHEAVLRLVEKMRDRLCNMHYNGEIFEADPTTLALTHVYEDKTSPSKGFPNFYVTIGLSLAGALSGIAALIAGIMCCRQRKAFNFSPSSVEKYPATGFENLTYQSPVIGISVDPKNPPEKVPL